MSQFGGKLWGYRADGNGGAPKKPTPDTARQLDAAIEEALLSTKQPAEVLEAVLNKCGSDVNRVQRRTVGVYVRAYLRMRKK